MKTTFLAIGAGLLSLAVAAQTTVRQMVPTDLNEEDTKRFLDCVKATGGQYEISVDDQGWIVVIPAENRELDLNGTDSELFKCLRQAKTMQVALGGTGDGREEYRNAKGVHKHDHASLVWAGARGQIGREIKATTHHMYHNDSATDRDPILQRSDVDYYAAFYSDDDTCVGDYNNYYYGSCANFWTPTIVSRPRTSTLATIRCLVSSLIINVRRETRESSWLSRARCAGVK